SGQLQQTDLGARPALLAHHQRQPNVQVDDGGGERKIEPRQQPLLRPPGPPGILRRCAHGRRPAYSHTGDMGKPMPPNASMSTKPALAKARGICPCLGTYLPRNIM